MKTKAVVFPKVDTYELRELELDDLGPSDVLVKTLVTAISPGTERRILRGKHIGTQFPCVPGYQRLGIVEDCGPNVVNLRPGDIVYGYAGRWKEKNVNCLFGAHVEYSVASEKAYKFYADTMPSVFELETSAFIFLIGVAHRGMRFLNAQPTERILIIGAGIIGIYAAYLAGLNGAIPVLIDIDLERISFVRNLGLKILNSMDKDLEAKLREIAPQGFDYLYDTVGHAPTTDRCVQLMRRQGTLLMQAQYFDKDQCAVDLDQIKIKELTIKTTCSIDEHDWQQVRDYISRRILKVAPIITHRFNARDVLKGYELLQAGKPFNLGIVFIWDKLTK